MRQLLELTRGPQAAAHRPTGVCKSGFSLRLSEFGITDKTSATAQKSRSVWGAKSGARMFGTAALVAAVFVLSSQRGSLASVDRRVATACEVQTRVI